MDLTEPTNTSINNATKMHSIFSKNSEYNSILLSDGNTKLIDLLLSMSDCDRFSKFLADLPDVNASILLESPIWPGWTALHLAVSMTDNTKLWDELLKKSDPNQQLDSLIEVQDSLEEEKINYSKRIDICLERGCNVNNMNAQGQTPIHLAFALHNAELTDLLLDKCDEKAINYNDLSFLHIACATGNADVVRQLIQAQVDIHHQTKVSFEWFSKCSFHTNREPKLVIVPVNSTALHIAATFQHKTIVELLLDQGGNVHAENALGLTPIHLSMVSCPEDAMFHKDSKSIGLLLLKKDTHLRESLSSCGLSHLHIAAYVDDKKSIKKLLRMGSKIDSIFKITMPELEYLRHYANRTPLHIAIYMWSEKTAASLIVNGADIFNRMPEITTPLQEMMRYRNEYNSRKMHKYINNKLKSHEHVNEVMDANGMTLLHVACFKYKFKWARKLLKKGADVNAKIFNDQVEHASWKDCTPMHMLIDSVCEKIDEDREEIIEFVKLLIKYGADIVATNHNKESPLLLARALTCEELYSGNDYLLDEEYAKYIFPITDYLLENQSSYAINPVNTYGYSHFHYACMRNNVEIVRKFLDNGIDINHTANIMLGEQNAIGFTPLHFAMHYGCKEVAYLLIKRGANVNAVNENDETPFHIAAIAELVDFELYEVLLSHGANINARTYDDSTPLLSFLKWNNNVTHKQLKFFINHGLSIEALKVESDGLIGYALMRATESDRDLILQELIEFCKVNNAVENNVNPIAHIASIYHDMELGLEFYLNTIQKFMDIGCKLDKRDMKGRTAFHKAVWEDNVEAVEALLLLGANVNIIDKNNEPPINIDHCDKTVAQMFAAHVWKMKFVGLKVHELCEASMVAIHEKYPLDEDLRRRCEKELADLAKENIGESLTIRCLLQEWSPAMDYPTMSFVQRFNIDKFFAKSDDLRKQFPQFCGLLMIQYRKIIARVDMYEIAMRLLPSVLCVDLPALCLDNILKYFDNDELEYFIKSHDAI